RRRLRVPLIDHHPAVVLEHLRAALVRPRGLDPHDAVLAALVLLLADYLGDGAHGVSRVHRLAEADGRVTEVRHGVERYVVYGLAEDHVKDEKIVDRLAQVTERSRELRRAV